MKDEIINIVAEVLEINPDKITLETNLVTDLEVESLDVVDLIAAFEEKFNIYIPDNEIKKLLTISDIVSYIESHV